MEDNDKLLAMRILQNVGAVTRGHFVYTSGRHGSAYVNKDAVYLHPQATSRLCCMLARHFQDAGVEVVVGTALGGIPLSQWTVYHLRQLTRWEVLAAFTEEEGGTKVFRRGYESVILGKKVLVPESRSHRRVSRGPRTLRADGNTSRQLDGRGVPALPRQGSCQRGDRSRKRVA